MVQSIFDFEDYRDYLNQHLRQMPKRGHGFRAKMAEAMKCEGSYVSRILNGHAHIHLEQAEALSRLLEHTSEEFDFFVAMVQFARTGTSTLRDYFKRQMEAIVNRRLKVRHRIPSELPLTVEQQARYFSHWEYAAVHMLLLIPELQEKERLAQHLIIPFKRLTRILEFLLEAGLAVQENARFKVGPAVIQLPGDSPLAQHHHVNWRHRAIQAVQNEPDQGLHYSSILTLSSADARKIREIYIQSIERMNAVVDQSGNETALALLIDCFEI